MDYRTDLAIERKEILDEEGGDSSEIKGISVKKTDYGDGVIATNIVISEPKAAARMKKAMGCYVTVEAEGILDDDIKVKSNVVKALADELGKMIKFHDKLKVLVVGLGNRQVTPDSLGPAAASKIFVTRHMFIMLDAESDEEASNVACLVPGVMASTGMETADVIKKAVEICCPDIVIAIDSLAARNIKRMSTTIQLTDTGISPGAGIGNERTTINSEIIGAKVIAIGVPTVIDAARLACDDVGDNNRVVTSTDIDMIIEEFSDIISDAINITLHPGIYM